MAQLWIDLEAVQLWEKNYNRGSISRLKKMFRRFGFNGALKLWNGTCMAGNNSTIALRELQADGWVPSGAGIRVDKGGGWQVAYLDVSHLSAAESEAFALSDNHSARIASPDMAQMAALIGDLEDADKELIEVVFTADELAEFEDLARLADGLESALADDANSAGEGKRVGHERAKQVKVVVPISDLATFEAALLKTGEVNRGAALLTVCEAYLRGKK